MRRFLFLALNLVIPGTLQAGIITLQWTDISAGRDVPIVVDFNANTATIPAGSTWGGSEHWTTNQAVELFAHAAGYTPFSINAGMFASLEDLRSSGFGTTWIFTQAAGQGVQDISWNEGVPSFNSFAMAFGNGTAVQSANLIIFSGDGSFPLDFASLYAQTLPLSGGNFRADTLTGFGGGAAVPEPGPWAVLVLLCSVCSLFYRRSRSPLNV